MVQKKFKSTISVLIFRSGSIIITGGNLLSDYNEIYLHLLEIVKNNILKLKFKNIKILIMLKIHFNLF